MDLSIWAVNIADMSIINASPVEGNIACGRFVKIQKLSSINIFVLWSSLVHSIIHLIRLFDIVSQYYRLHVLFLAHFLDAQ